MLRNLRDLKNYKVSASDGEIGHVSGHLVDDETWVIRYLVVDTSTWWMGPKVLVTPPWITGVHWSDRTVSIDLSRESIKRAPLHDPAVDWTHDQDLRLYRHHGRHGFGDGARLLEAEI